MIIIAKCDPILLRNVHECPKDMKEIDHVALYYLTLFFPNGYHWCDTEDYETDPSHLVLVYLVNYTLMAWDHIRGSGSHAYFSEYFHSGN